jgi:hypothetical protein
MEQDISSCDDWKAVTALLPSDWELQAKCTGAVLRSPKKFGYSVGNVLRTLLLHVGKGYSLKETSVRARQSKISDASDVGILKALRRSESWLQSLCVSLYKENIPSLPQSDNKITMRLVDGTSVKEPGKTGSLWRIHYSITLPGLSCDYFKLTKSKGKDVHETFKKYPIKENDCIIGDRGYSQASGIAYIHAHKAYTIVRVNTNSLPVYNAAGERFDLLAAARSLDGSVSAEFGVSVKSKDGDVVQGRVCIIKKSNKAAEKDIKKLKSAAIRKQRIIKPNTLEYAKYIIVFTNLPPDSFTKDVVLEWYRIRWQIELAFKRLKSLAGLGHLPKYDECSSRAWLYGKLLVGLLTNKLIRYADNFSPWGYPNQSNTAT